MDGRKLDIDDCTFIRHTVQAPSLSDDPVVTTWCWKGSRLAKAKGGAHDQNDAMMHPLHGLEADLFDLQFSLLDRHVPWAYNSRAESYAGARQNPSRLAQRRWACPGSS